MTELLSKKLNTIADSYKEFFENPPESEVGFAAVISICDKTARAKTVRACAEAPSKAYENACAQAEELVRRTELSPLWVRADISAAFRKVTLSELNEELAECKYGLFRRGVSFAEDMSMAVTESEISGSRIIPDRKKGVELPVLNRFLSRNGMNTLAALPENLVLFDCESRFCGEDEKALTLYGCNQTSDRNNYGRRIVPDFDDKTALSVISTASEYLSNQVRMDGKFEYGVYPIAHKAIAGYNILRHASSIWSLICSYRLTGDKFVHGQIIKAIGFMVNNCFKKYPDKEGELNTVFLVDKERKEIKLGGNAVAVIVLTEYMKLTGSDRYKKLCCELGNGILELFDSRDGSYFHVLNFPEMSPKDKYRTVYYDGEAAFALSRLYSLTGEKKWLDAASLAVDRFIREGYEKHRDHWVAYAVNELTMYLPKDKYLSFGLKNAQANLEKIYRQETTFHTYLELLCVTFELYSRIREQKLSCSYLEKFNVKRFIETIYHRADYMLGGYFYPEYAMYLKYPAEIEGAFFIRHDRYRMRIDDIQHFCGGYYSFYRNYESLKALKAEFSD